MKNRLKWFLWMSIIIGMVNLLWIGFYGLLWGMDQVGQPHRYPFARYLIGANLGMLCLTFIFSCVGKYHKPRRMNYFQAIIQAIREMAKGNFNIDLELPIAPGPAKNDPFRQLSDSLHYMAKELGQIEHMRQEFISNVSHEIQSPLTSIKGFARALENSKIPEDKRLHYLQIIQTETERLSNLSDHLLKLTSLENDRHPLVLSDYRADRQIRQIILLNEPRWQEKNLQMDIHMNPVLLHADADLMNQVWSNLIQNSIKFTPCGGKVSIKLLEKKDALLFEISDSGPGIRPEDQIHLFERFYKADRSRNRSQGGNGLGLSIVEKIVKLHGGKITVSSDLGKGTVFTITLSKKKNKPEHSQTNQPT
ncbi:MAG: HAMP domain-containing sensor histidine kinase [Sporolactobacillus sp.]